MNIFADDLIFDMSDFSFSWKLLLTLRYFIDVTMPYRCFSNSSNKVICGERDTQTDNRQTDTDRQRQRKIEFELNL